MIENSIHSQKKLFTSIGSANKCVTLPRVKKGIYIRRHLKWKILELRSSILAIDGVQGVNDIHVWSLSREVTAMTAHALVTELDKEQTLELLHKIQHTSYEEFGIAHTTIQFEYCACSSCFHNKIDHKKQCSMCIDLCPMG